MKRGAQLHETTDKAESDLAVAAASTVARAEFLLRLQHLSDEIGTTLPKGASPAVELAGRMIVKKYGEERLGSVAKLHFKTTPAMLGKPARPTHRPQGPTFYRDRGRAWIRQELAHSSRAFDGSRGRYGDLPRV